MKKIVTVLILPENDRDIVSARHWLVAKHIDFKTIYVPVDNEQKTSVMMCQMTRWDKLLFKLSFGFKTEKIVAFG